MTPLELLVCVLGIPFFVVEVYQLYMLRKSQQRLTCIWEKVLEQPEYAGEVVANAIIGLIDKVEDDEEFGEELVVFVQRMSITAVNGVRTYLARVGPGDPVDMEMQKEALKGMPKWMKQGAKLANYVGIDVKEIMKRGAKAKVDAVVDTAMEGW